MMEKIMHMLAVLSMTPCKKGRPLCNLDLPDAVKQAEQAILDFHCTSR